MPGKIESNRRVDGERAWTKVRRRSSLRPISDRSALASVERPKHAKGARYEDHHGYSRGVGDRGRGRIGAGPDGRRDGQFLRRQFQGTKTASGEAFDKNGLTASHKRLPFGTKVKVTNVENGKSVVVTVNDRMAASNPAVIDVTRRAAEELDFAKTGKAKVKVEVQK
jgi:rare lipoprotein A